MKLTNKAKLIIWSIAAIIAGIAVGNYITSIDGALSVILATILLVVSINKLADLTEKL